MSSSALRGARPGGHLPDDRGRRCPGPHRLRPQQRACRGPVGPGHPPTSVRSAGPLTDWVRLARRPAVRRRVENARLLTARPAAPTSMGTPKHRRPAGQLIESSINRFIHTLKPLQEVIVSINSHKPPCHWRTNRQESGKTTPATRPRRLSPQKNSRIIVIARLGGLLKI